MDDKKLPFGFDDDPSRALALMSRANAVGDDDATAAAAERARAADAAARSAQNALAAAQRVSDFPRDHLEHLKTQDTRAGEARTRLAADLHADRVRQQERLTERIGEVLGHVLARPADADPAADAIEQQDLRRRLEAMDAGERELMLRHAARDGGREQRPLLRAALGGPKVPWASTAFPALVREDTARDLREWLVARAAPELVRDAKRVWRLRKIATDLELAPWTPPMTAPPSLADLGVNITQR